MKKSRRSTLKLPDQTTFTVSERRKDEFPGEFHDELGGGEERVLLDVGDETILKSMRISPPPALDNAMLALVVVSMIGVCAFVVEFIYDNFEVCFKLSLAEEKALVLETDEALQVIHMCHCSSRLLIVRELKTVHEPI